MSTLESFQHDLRVAIRGLIRDRGFTAAALFTFALCLGANVALFAVVNAVILRPLPYPQPSQLVTVYNSYPKAGVEKAGVSVPYYLARRDGVDAFAEAAAYRSGGETVGEAGSPDRVESMNVTPSFFKVLGVAPQLGRTFDESEGVYGKNNVVVLSDSFWHQKFAGDPKAIGRTLHFGGGQVCTIIGVMPPGFQFDNSHAKVWLPLCFSDDEKKMDNLHSNNMAMVARLRPGFSIAQAQAQVDALNTRIEEKDPFAKYVLDAGFSARVVDLHADQIQTAKPVLVLLQAGVLCLLAIGTVNLANLFLVRAIGRTKELSIRRVLGADSPALARQLLTETLLLSLAGGLVGLALGWAALHSVEGFGLDRLPHAGAFGLDRTVCLAALAGSLVVGLLLALPVLWHSLRGNLAASLSVESRGGTTTRATHRLRHGLIIAQFSLAFVLLAGAGMLGLSFSRVTAVRPGFEADHLLTGDVPLPWGNYKKDEQRLAFVQRLQQELHTIPGVTYAGFTTMMPFTPGGSQNAIFVEGHAMAPGETLHAHYFSGVAGDFFQALHIPLIEGRYLTTEDSTRATHACVVDEKVARFYWPHGSALGHRLFNGPPTDENKKAFTIVGVVGTIKQHDLAETQAMGSVYVPFVDYAGLEVAVVLRTAQAPQAAASALRAAVLRVDPQLPVEDLKTMDARIDDSLQMRRAPFVLACIFAGVALALATVGLYGVLAYSVAQRRREIGIRLALGAVPGAIRSQFLWLGVKLAAAGMVIGGVGAWLGGRAMTKVLFEVGALNPPILGATAGVLALVAITACYWPAAIAARVPPMEALRGD